MTIKLAGCVILNDYGDLLLLHRDRGDDSCWELPGGKLEPDETAEVAAVRELGEELAVEVRLVKALGSETFEEDEKNYHYTWFQAEIIAGEPSLQEPDTFDDFAYFALEDLPELALSSNMLVLYPKLMNGELPLDS